MTKEADKSRMLELAEDELRGLKNVAVKSLQDITIQISKMSDLRTRLDHLLQVVSKADKNRLVVTESDLKTILLLFNRLPLGDVSEFVKKIWRLAGNDWKI